LNMDRFLCWYRVLPIVTHVKFRTVVRQRRICETVVAFGAHEEEYHPCLFSFRLVLVEHGTGDGFSRGLEARSGNCVLFMKTSRTSDI
jgi:hypothetical protein